MYLNEGNLLHNVRLRYFDNKIYVSVDCAPGRLTSLYHD